MHLSLLDSMIDMEQHVARSRGHSRKRRKEYEKEGKVVPDIKSQALERKPIAWLEGMC